MDHPRLYDIDDHWTREFGLPAGFFPSTGFTLIPSPEMEDAGITVLHRLKGSTVIVVAPSRAPLLRRALFAAASESGVTTHDLGAQLTDADVAPDWQETIYYLPPDEFRQADKHLALPLNEASGHLLDHLLDACGTAERSAADLRIDHDAVFACFTESRIVAAATGVLRDGDIVDVSSITHPQDRRRGYGKAALTAVCIWAMEKDAIVQFQVPDANLAAVRLARSLGFAPYLTMEVIRHGTAVG